MTQNSRLKYFVAALLLAGIAGAAAQLPGAASSTQPQPSAASAPEVQTHTPASQNSVVGLIENCANCDFDELKRTVAEFNRDQDARLMTSPRNSGDPLPVVLDANRFPLDVYFSDVWNGDRQIGHIRLYIEKLGHLIHIFQVETIEKHTDPIDAGRDHFKHYFFRTQPNQFQSSEVGPLFLNADRKLALSIPSENSCAGVLPLNTTSNTTSSAPQMKVTELETAQSWFAGPFPEHTTFTVNSADEKGWALTLKTETQIENPSGDQTAQCEISSPAEISVIEMRLDCSAGQCQFKELSRTSSIGCASVGGCD